MDRQRAPPLPADRHTGHVEEAHRPPECRPWASGWGSVGGSRKKHPAGQAQAARLGGALGRSGRPGYPIYGNPERRRPTGSYGFSHRSGFCRAPPEGLRGPIGRLGARALRKRPLGLLAASWDRRSSCWVF